MTEGASRDAAAFETAWNDFCRACANTVAPEATYQAWLSHFLIGRLELLRVVREVDFGSQHLLAVDAARYSGHNLMVDIAVLRQPVVDLPRRALLRKDWDRSGGSPDPASGLGRVALFSVLSELKVAATQADGLDQAQVLRDFEKLSAILSAAEDKYPGAPLPAAFVGVLGNHKQRRYRFDSLREKVDRAREQGRVRSDVFLLTSEGLDAAS